MRGPHLNQCKYTLIKLLLDVFICLRSNMYFCLFPVNIRTEILQWLISDWAEMNEPGGTLLFPWAFLANGITPEQDERVSSGQNRLLIYVGISSYFNHWVPFTYLWKACESLRKPNINLLLGFAWGLPTLFCIPDRTLFESKCPRSERLWREGNAA